MSRAWRLAGVVWVLLVASSSPLDAQIQPGPIGRFVADAHASLARYGQSDGLASAEGVAKTALPSRGLGFDLGAHVYFARLGPITFGAGGHWFASRGSRTPAIPKGSQTPGGPTVRTTFTEFSPQLSFNFGSEQGWSYLSGGLGSSRLTVRTETTTPATRTNGDQLPRAKTIDYGGGARWFYRDRLAFSLDLRFYAINPQLGVGDRPGRPRMTLLVVSGGISIK